MMNFRLWLNKWKIPSALFFPKHYYLPDPNIEIYVVIGKPLILPKIDKPSY